DEACVGLDTADLERARPPAEHAVVHGARGDLVAGLRNVLGALLEQRSRGGDTKPIRLTEDPSGAPILHIESEGLQLGDAQRVALFDPMLQADLRAQRMRFDIRLVIARELFARNGAEIAAETTASSGTRLVVTFSSH